MSASLPPLHPTPPPPASSPSPVLTADEQRLAFTAAFDPSLRKAKVFCLLVVRWWEDWCEYTGFDRDTVPPPEPSSPSSPAHSLPPLEDADLVLKKSNQRPGRIDNSPLLRLLHPTLPIHALHPHLQEHTDFVFLNSEAFALLHAWYGGGPVIERKVVSRGWMEELIIELHPVTLLYCYVDEHGRIIRSLKKPPGEEDVDGAAEDGAERNSLAQRRVATFSKDATVRSIINELRPPFAVDAQANPLEGRVWLRIPREGTPGAVSEEEEDDEFVLVHEKEYNSTLEFLDWTSGMDIALEYRHPLQTERWCRSSGKKKGEAWRDFETGDEVDALDTMNKWYESVIRQVQPAKDGAEARVYVHFKGWQDKWDEWREVSSKGLAPRSLYTTGARDAAASRIAQRDPVKYNSAGTPIQKGAVGLRNLGNTCFMNSIIQSMIQTPVLTHYFLDKRYRKELNRGNPLGWQGKIAEEYGELVEEMWGGQYSVVAPKMFKQVLGEFQPRFSGYQQHDSSEFLSFLLDGLHEDLNRVHKKPSTQPVESGGRPDPVVAKDAWERHLQRNQSIIVDLCQGQFKSKVVCPECQRESITFDPYLFLSLPIPQQTHVYRELTFVPTRGTAQLLKLKQQMPFLVTVQLPKHATVADIKHALGVALKVPLLHAKLLLTELHEGRILKALGETAPVDKIRDKDALCMYEVDELIHNKGVTEKWTTLQVTQWVRSDQPGAKMRQAGIPTVVALPSHLLSAMPIRLLYQRLRDCMACLVLDREDDDGSTDHPMPDAYSTASANGHGSVKMKDENAFLSSSQSSSSNGHSSPGPSLRSDAFQFDVVLMDRPQKSIICDIPRPKSDSDSAEFDLMTRGQGGFSFMCVHPASHASLLLQAGSLTSINPIDPVLMSASSKRHLTVFDCLNAFTLAETLRASEAWYCPTCKTHQQATKKIDLWTVPSVLILHLKRFSFTSSYRDKIDVKIDFPVEGLDLSAFVRGGPVGEGVPSLMYDLYAVSNHYGGLGGGHYTAYAKNLKNQQWYSLDDSSVSAVHPQTVVTEAAYVLFYHRRGLGRTATNERSQAQLLNSTNRNRTQPG